MKLPSPAFLIASLLAFSIACRKEQPSAQGAPAPSAQAAIAATAAASLSPSPSNAPLPSTVGANLPAPVASLRTPTPLDAAGLRTAKLYLAELSRGRQATVAKDYARADDHFSKCLAALPADARALGERGYARLLANKLPEAEADLAAAMRGAPSSAVLLQILHNLMLVARQRGDEVAAERYQAEKMKLKAARRLPTGVTCSSTVTESALEPQVTSSVHDALEQLLRAHATREGAETTAVKFVAGPLDELDQAAQLRLLAAKGPLPDGGTQLWSSGKELRNHVLLAYAGKLYGYADQSSGSMSLCGLDGAADLSVGGGGTRPWYIQRTRRQLERGYVTHETGQTMGFCAWALTEIDVTFLDAKTLEGIRTLAVSAQPTDDTPAQEPEHLLELEWQADRVVAEACGQRSVVPYAPD